ncbi:ABC transporter substrate-binding protein [Actinoplanes derwentensis]|uniref:Alpha-1,4-digalacturonate transport system substrate-binding protein n=1 Tax=Actinoplanes derwentensis TaxID=113562 RepID=A0A1H1STQ0_9ACTN|nr:sugar ABC transporter substrate-binding protein [Actinoplanes derwentensis]GID83210.1 sugar ABC transporter substrate-binding protein [Actinoplanes derwentensis]SDS51400.1 alpha-1,4-digalacturonate transport system substrate-binding protein [Actinoplanes derwentensis]
MRKYSLISALLAGALVLSGCSGSDDAAGAKSLQFLLSGDASQGGGYQAMADKYEKETGVHVEIVDVPYDDLTTRLRSGAQANNLPALARASEVDPLWQSALQDLSDIAEKEKVLPSLLVRNADDEVQALPSDLTAVGLFLNKTLFDKAGVKYPGIDDKPWTWDEYVAALKKVQAATGAKYGMVMDGSAHRLRSFLYQFGSKGVQKQADGSYALDATGGQALEYFKGLNDDKVMPKSVWVSGDDPSALFKSGQVAAYYSGVWQVTDFAENITDFEWTTALMPAQPVRATNIGTNWIVAFDGTGVEKETKEFLSWLYRQDNYTELSQIAGFLPAEEGLSVTYKTSQDAFAMFNAEIAASDEIAGYQATTALADSYEGRLLNSEPLKDQTIKYLAGEQDLATTVKAIGDDTTKQYSK